MDEKKESARLKNRAAAKRFREKNKAKVRRWCLSWASRNKKHIADYVRKRRQRPDIRLRKNAANAKYLRKIFADENLHAAYLAKVRARYHKTEKHNVQSILKRNLRMGISSAVRRRKTSRSGSAVRLLGCSVDALKKHLESKFTVGMTWDNYGLWHIDHIKPLAKFDLSVKSQAEEVCHYTNLQPLWASENIRKSSKMPT